MNLSFMEWIVVILSISALLYLFIKACREERWEILKTDEHYFNNQGDNQ